MLNFEVVVNSYNARQVRFREGLQEASDEYLRKKLTKAILLTDVLAASYAAFAEALGPLLAQTSEDSRNTTRDALYATQRLQRQESLASGVDVGQLNAKLNTATDALLIERANVLISMAHTVIDGCSVAVQNTTMAVLATPDIHLVTAALRATLSSTVDLALEGVPGLLKSTLEEAKGQLPDSRERAKTTNDYLTVLSDYAGAATIGIHVVETLRRFVLEATPDPTNLLHVLTTDPARLRADVEAAKRERLATVSRA
jgi:hypothetical protein